MSTEIIDNIENNKITVFSKTYCGYCDKTKNTIKKLNINQVVIYECDRIENFETILRNKLFNKTRMKTFPQVIYKFEK